MNLNLNRPNNKDVVNTPKAKHVTFKDTVEWASSSPKDEDNSPTKKYTFWMLLMGVLAMVVVVWILMMFMSKYTENAKSDNNGRSKSSQNERSKHTSHKSSGSSVLGGMMSDSGSIQPDSGSQFRKKSSRPYSFHNSNGRRGGSSSKSRSNLVNPLPVNGV